MEKINKLSLPVTILMTSIVLGGFYYASEVNKQKSIEKQQQIEVSAKKVQDQAKTERDKRDYIAKRKTDCLAIYKTESGKFGNVQGWRYNEHDSSFWGGVDDQCEVIYKDDKTGENFSNYF